MLLIFVQDETHYESHLQCGQTSSDPPGQCVWLKAKIHIHRDAQRLHLQAVHPQHLREMGPWAGLYQGIPGVHQPCELAVTLIRKRQLYKAPCRLQVPVGNTCSTKILATPADVKLWQAHISWSSRFGNS